METDANLKDMEAQLKVWQIKLLRVPSRRSASSHYSEYCCVGRPPRITPSIAASASLAPARSRRFI